MTQLTSIQQIQRRAIVRTGFEFMTEFAFGAWIFVARYEFNDDTIRVSHKSGEFAGVEFECVRLDDVCDDVFSRAFAGFEALVELIAADERIKLV